MPPDPLLGTCGLAGRELGPSGGGTSEVAAGSGLDDKSSSTERALETSVLLAEIKFSGSLCYILLLQFNLSQFLYKGNFLKKDCFSL